MAYRLAPATQSDIPAWATACYDASQAPHKPFSMIMVPPLTGVHPDSPARCDAQVAGLTELFANGLWHIPGATHLKVEHAESGALVGGALYVDIPQWPGPEEDSVALWQPEGGQRDYATRALRANEVAHREMISGAHIYMYIVFTLPAHRNRGVASMLMRHMTGEADRRELPCWLESTEIATHCYKKHGFEIVRVVDITPKPESEEEAEEEGWRRMKEWMKGAPITQYCMMRPRKS